MTSLAKIVGSVSVLLIISRKFSYESEACCWFLSLDSVHDSHPKIPTISEVKPTINKYLYLFQRELRNSVFSSSDEESFTLFY